MAWLSGWSYRKEITITGQSGAGTNYQVEFDIGDSAGGDFHLEGHCTNFPQDIQVTDNDESTLLDYWIEDITADPLKLWVEVADDLGTNKTIYIYYGKSGASTDSNIEDTFLFGDDFPGSSIDGGKWDNTEGMTINVSSGILTVSTSVGETRRIYTQNQYSTDTAVRTLAKWSTTGDVYAGFGYYVSGGANYIEVIPTYSTNQGYVGFKKDPNSSGPQFMTAASGDVTAYNIWDVKRFSASVKTYLKNTLELDYTTTANIPTVNLTNDIMIYSNTIIGYFDWYLLRKLIANEPAFSSAGAEQTPPTGVSPTGVFYGPLVGPLGGPI